MHYTLLTLHVLMIFASIFTNYLAILFVIWRHILPNKQSQNALRTICLTVRNILIWSSTKLKTFKKYLNAQCLWEGQEYSRMFFEKWVFFSWSFAWRASFSETNQSATTFFFCSETLQTVFLRAGSNCVLIWNVSKFHHLNSLPRNTCSSGSKTRFVHPIEATRFRKFSMFLHFSSLLDHFKFFPKQSKLIKDLRIEMFQSFRYAIKTLKYL